MRNRRVNIHRFTGNALLLVWLEVLQRPHVMQAIGKLDQDDAHVGHHGQEHLAHVFGLARLRRRNVQPTNVGDARDEVRNFASKPLFNPRNGIFRVLNGIVKNGRGQRDGIESHVREDMRHFEQVRQVGLTRAANLVVMSLRSNLVSTANDPGIFRWAVFLELF